MGALKTVGSLAAIGIAIFCGLIYKEIVTVHSLYDRSDFMQNIPYTIGEVPMTHYHAGKINELISDWDRTFRLYRVFPNESFSVDIDKLKITETRAKEITLGTDRCKWESVFCTPCMDFSKDHPVTINQVFTERKWYASFAKITTDAVIVLWNAMNFPFNYHTKNMEHAFISNLDQHVLTASMHANPGSTSMAVQYTGRKTWLFFDTETYINDFGAVPASPLLLPRKSPNRPYTVYVYTSEPGDILFFPEAYAHVVVTHSGPNIMINYRNVYLGNVWKHPVTWATAMFNFIIRARLLGRGHAVFDNNKKANLVLDDPINKDVHNKIDSALCEPGLTQFDQNMIQVLKDELKKY